MKLIKIQIKGIAMHDDTVIDVNKPLMVFFGDVQQGKTTILNAVRWGLGCQVPEGVIKKGCNEGEIFLTFENATSRRSFYINKEGVEVPRPLEYIENGRLVKEPIKYLKSKVNPFLLDNEYFMKMTFADQMKFFVQLFGIDTSEENRIITEKEATNKSLRIEIKAIGDINPIEVVKPDVEALKEEKANIDSENAKDKERYDSAVEARNKSVSDTEIKEKEILEIDRQIKELQLKRDVASKWISENTLPPVPVEPEYKPTEELEEKISNAKADEILYQNYLKDKEKLDEKNKKEEALKSGELAVKNARQKKLDKLAGFSEKTGIDGLLFVEGGYTYQGIQFDMLATSQRQDLSNKLSALFPSDFDIDLIDRAESLGKKNLINLGKLASEKGRTIIATVVSDELAIDDEHVGVFRVDNGEVSNG